MKDIYELLKKYYGYDSFRAGQEKIIRNILAGRDVLAVMPTGGGKSLCYQLPALALDGITIVISPLISLMQDQVRNLIAMGIRGAYLNSSLTSRQIALATENAVRGVYKIIYVAPERLDTPSFLSFAANADISLIAVDEAHCISQWGQDFRPAYLRIKEFTDKLPKRPPVAAFTATAAPAVRNDITEKLALRSPFTFIGGFDRPNLYFGVRYPDDKIDFADRYISAHKDESGILYCLTRRETEKAADALSSLGHSVKAYHAGMSDEERKAVQKDFIYGRIKVIAATNAFGMGIDKPDVRFVIHINMPARIEDYYQQAGRAGRDGEKAECILLYSPSDVSINRYMIENVPEDDPLDPKQRQQNINSRLTAMEQMIFYCKSKHTCLRKRLISYFGQSISGDCGNCSVCSKKQPLISQETERHYDEALYSKLKALCKRFAMFAGVPFYTIASEKMLREMAEIQPETIAELRKINGLGEEKIKRYGQQFTDTIKSHKQNV